MPKSVLWFSETDKYDVPIVGGKAANLGELTKISVPVPPGFTINSQAYFGVLKSRGLDIKVKNLLKFQI